MVRMSNRTTSIGQELFLYAVSATLSCIILFVGLRHLDPNRTQSKRAAERKKEITKRLGRPLIQTNAYEVKHCQGAYCTPSQLGSKPLSKNHGVLFVRLHKCWVAPESIVLSTLEHCTLKALRVFIDYSNSYHVSLYYINTSS